MSACSVETGSCTAGERHHVAYCPLLVSSWTTSLVSGLCLGLMLFLIHDLLSLVFYIAHYNKLSPTFATDIVTV